MFSMSLILMHVVNKRVSVCWSKESSQKKSSFDGRAFELFVSYSKLKKRTIIPIKIWLGKVLHLIG